MSCTTETPVANITAPSQTEIWEPRGRNGECDKRVMGQPYMPWRQHHFPTCDEILEGIRKVIQCGVVPCHLEHATRSPAHRKRSARSVSCFRSTVPEGVHLLARHGMLMFIDARTVVPADYGSRESQERCQKSGVLTVACHGQTKHMYISPEAGFCRNETHLNTGLGVSVVFAVVYNEKVSAKIAWGAHLQTVTSWVPDGRQWAKIQRNSS